MASNSRTQASETCPHPDPGNCGGRRSNEQHHQTRSNNHVQLPSLAETVGSRTASPASTPTSSKDPEPLYVLPSFLEPVIDTADMVGWYRNEEVLQSEGPTPVGDSNMWSIIRTWCTLNPDRREKWNECILEQLKDVGYQWMTAAYLQSLKLPEGWGVA